MRHQVLCIALGASVAVAGLGTAGQAATPEQADMLYDLLKMQEIVSVMAEEGLDYGADLEEAMFPGSGGAHWRSVLGDIYDADRMQATVRSGFQKALSNETIQIAEMIAFYSSDLGQHVVELELSARRAILDPDIDMAAREATQEAKRNEDDRIGQIEAFIDVNDLIERNVVGSLNSNIAFFHGLSRAGGDLYRMSEEEILTDAWNSEAELRKDSEEWLLSYLNLAYQPLSEAELDSYIEFSDSSAGRMLLDASFEAYNHMFNAISETLGTAAGEFAMSQEL